MQEQNGRNSNGRNGNSRSRSTGNGEQQEDLQVHELIPWNDRELEGFVRRAGSRSEDQDQSSKQD